MIADDRLPVKCTKPKPSRQKNKRLGSCIYILLDYIRPNTKQEEEKGGVEWNLKTNSYFFEGVPNCFLYVSGLCSRNKILVQNM